MSENYMAIYDAVRSKMSHIDGNEIKERIILNNSFDHMIGPAIESICYEHIRPSVLFRPALSIDGNQWCALYGNNLQDGIAGFGDTAVKAMSDFDDNFQKLNAKRT